MWRDLDMPSGHAYAKALRTVKTCVGSRVVPLRHAGFDARWARTLERALWRMYAPHKVKLAVSGCPRNCAESGIKDVGVIGVDSGWEIYVAGNGGIKTEVAQFLVKVKTADEVLEYAGAFLQLYREEGWYLERTVHFVARVGLDYVKKRVARRRRRAASAVGAAAVRARRRARPVARAARGGARSTCGSSCRSPRPSRCRRRSRGLTRWTAAAAVRRRPIARTVCAVDDIPRLGARVIERASTAATSRCSAPATIACSRSPTAARTRAARCRRASCSATASPVRCTTGRSSSTTGCAVAPDEGCARALSRCESRTAIACSSRSRSTRMRGRDDGETVETRSTCCYCGVGCGVVIEHDGARITGVRGDPDHPGEPRQAVQQGQDAAPHGARPRRSAYRATHPLRAPARGAPFARVRLGRRARLRSPTASPTAFASTGPTASRSTCPASS